MIRVLEANLQNRKIDKGVGLDLVITLASKLEYV